MSHRLIFSFIPFLVLSFGFAQDSLGIKHFKKSYLRDDQHFHFNIPLYLPSFKGDFSYGDITIEPDDDDDGGGSGGNIFDKFFNTKLSLEFFFLGQLGYENEAFFIDADIYLGNIGGSLQKKDNEQEIIQLSVKATLPRLISGYKVYHYLSDKKTFSMEISPYWGIRAQSFRVRSESHPEAINDFQLLSPLTIEPIVGVRVPLNLRRWQITTQMDVGSFGIKKRWSFMANIHASYHFSKFMAFRFGWAEYDLRKRALFDNLTYKVHLRGPTMGLNFLF